MNQWALQNGSWQRIHLGNGVYALCDEEDYEKLASFAWHLYADGHGSRYAERRFKSNPCPHCGRRSNKSEYMHRMVARCMGILCDENANTTLIDHINGDGLDNRRANLRATDAIGNGRNKRRRSGAYKGTSRAKSGRWAARITVNGTTISLGTFTEQIEAARVYDVAAVWAFGSFASLNIPHEWDDKEYIG